MSGSPDSSAPTGSSIQADVDTSSLTNGTHTFQMIGYVGTGNAATPPLLVQVSNQISNFSSDDAFQQDQGEVMNVTASAPLNTQQWTLQIINDGDGSVARTWQGSTPNINLAWDGLNTAGNVAADGNYTVQITAQLPSTGQSKSVPAAPGSSVLGKRPVALITGNPNALVLISKISNNGTLDQRLATTIATQLGVMQASNPGFKYTVLVSKGGATVHLRRLIRSWMINTVTDFYLWGHGFVSSPDSTIGGEWAGGINFWSKHIPTSWAVGRDAAKMPELHFIIPDMITRQYNFVMMDTCFSAGQGTIAFTGSDIYDPATPDDSWATAFRIGTDQNFSSCFYGWNGSAGFNSFMDGTLSNWEIWRGLFWKHLAVGGTVYQSANWATQHYVGASSSINPWDTNRAREVEDTNLP